jgi:HPt (histidine-containing phosphotransfer) domain-containing protein
MSAGVPDILLPIVSDFQESGSQSLAKLEAALAARQFAAAKDILHQLKGASGTIGLVRFQEACAQCEQHVVAQVSPPRLPELRPLLDESVAAATSYLRGE